MRSAINIHGLFHRQPSDDRGFGYIAGALAKISATGKVVSVHAEDDSLIVRSPEKGLHDHNRNRPPFAEASAISRLVKLHGSARINVCHVTSREAMDALAGTGFTKEVTVHHMLLDDSMPMGGLGKVNPPLRGKDDRLAMLDAFAQGRFDMLASDHAPHGHDEKSGDFDAAPSGVPGVETSVPIMMAMVKRGQISVGKARLCGMPASGRAVRPGQGHDRCGQGRRPDGDRPEEHDRDQGEEPPQQVRLDPVRGVRGDIPYRCVFKGDGIGGEQLSRRGAQRKGCGCCRKFRSTLAN